MKYKDLRGGQIIRARGKGYAPLLVTTARPGCWTALNLSAWNYVYIDKSTCHLYEDLGHVLDLLPADKRGEA